MSRSSEDVLLQVGQVKYKKYEGILFVMSERIGWMPGNKSNFSVTHKYTEIKSQKISPEGKSKIQLQTKITHGFIEKASMSGFIPGHMSKAFCKQRILGLDSTARFFVEKKT